MKPERMTQERLEVIKQTRRISSGGWLELNSLVNELTDALIAERARAERAEEMCDALNKALSIARGTR
jgi:ribosomal protein L7/L12